MAAASAFYVQRSLPIAVAGRPQQRSPRDVRRRREAGAVEAPPHPIASLGVAAAAGNPEGRDAVNLKPGNGDVSLEVPVSPFRSMHARDDGTARLNHTGQAGPDGGASRDMATEQLAALTDEILGTFEAGDCTATTHRSST